MDNCEFASVILQNTELYGVIRSDKAVLIQGILIGSVECGSLLQIDPLARVDGDIKTDELYLKGLVDGSIVARSVYLFQGACVKGTILCDQIWMEKDVKIEKGIRFK